MSEHEWQEAVGDGRGSKCRHIYDNLSTVTRSKSVPTWDRYINPQLQAPHADNKKDEECWETDFVNVEPLGYMQVSTHTVPVTSSPHLWQHWYATPVFVRFLTTVILLLLCLVHCTAYSMTKQLLPFKMHTSTQAVMFTSIYRTKESTEIHFHIYCSFSDI